MQELSLNEAILLGKRELNRSGLLFNPNSVTLATDFILPANYSGVLVLPANNKNGYEILLSITPAIQIPNTTFENLWECTKEHYGITVVTALAGAGSIPIDKIKLGYWVAPNSSTTTNISSHLGVRFFPRAKLPHGSQIAKVAKATFGTVRVFGIIGRAMPFVGIGLAVFDMVSISLCAYEAQNGK